jgi:hypothetical protein
LTPKLYDGRGSAGVRPLVVIILDSGVEPKGSDDVQQILLRLVELRLAGFGLDDPLLEADRDPIELTDLLDHFVGCAAELAEAALLGQCTVAALHQLAFGKCLGFADGLIHTNAGHAAVVVVRDFRRRLGEYESADVLDTVVADSQRDEELLPVNRDRSDLMVSTDGDWGHCV